MRDIFVGIESIINQSSLGLIINHRFIGDNLLSSRTLSQNCTYSLYLYTELLAVKNWDAGIRDVLLQLLFSIIRGSQNITYPLCTLVRTQKSCLPTCLSSTFHVPSLRNFFFCHHFFPISLFTFPFSIFRLTDWFCFPLSSISPKIHVAGQGRCNIQYTSRYLHIT